LEIGGDCSIEPDDGDEGVEIKFHPSTFQWWCANKEEIKALLNTDGFYTGNEYRCGMHIHLNRCVTSAHLFRILRVFYTNLDFMFYFSDRDTKQWDEWSSADPDDLTDYEDAMNDDGIFNHASLIDLSHTNTIEFRGFAGTDCVDKFYANLQLVEAIRILTQTGDVTIQEVYDFANSDPMFSELAVEVGRYLGARNE
jgi:hypothetical protein